MSGTVIAFENGKVHSILEFVILVQQKFEDLASFPEELVVRALKKRFDKNGLIVDWTPVDFVYRMDQARSRQVGTKSCGTFQVLIPWGDDFQEFSLGYREKGKAETFVPIVERIREDFTKVSYVAATNSSTTPVDTDCVVSTPLSGRGKWHVAQDFLAISQFPSIYLWRCEIPAHFEMHSHVESNHCSPFPPTWVHVWEAPGLVPGIANFLKLQPGFWWQDKISPLALGEGGKIGSKVTNAIGEIFGKGLAEAQMQQVFPMLADQADRIGCLMPMDLEYMHYNGYFGMPISRIVKSTRTDTGETESTRWFCWDSIWGFESNNVGYITSDGPHPPKFTEAPPSPNGEVWSWMTGDDGDTYESWKFQRNFHIPLATPNSASTTQLFPFYHFDPRRYTAKAAALEDGGWDLARTLSQPIQTNTAGNTSFVGFKLYTAMGWAPMDPYLREPLETFYKHCELHQIPILNHGTPAGYYTHDRRHYFDLLKRDVKVVDGPLNETVKRWTTRFAREIPGPDGIPYSPKTTKEERWWESREADRLWWFVHHYVSPQAWVPVLELFPMLKVCLAHFGDSDHFKDGNWDLRKDREPQKTRRDLSIAFVGDQIDPERTHRFLYDLLTLIQPKNRVFVDLSYVILDEHNVDAFQRLFAWARQHKPILLERILWGTDWPLIAAQDPVKNLKDGNMLQRYAQAFRNALPQMPGDFFVRACFLNPLQYLDMAGIKKLYGGQPGAPAWSWIDDLDPLSFDPKFGGDKAELFYRHRKGWTP